MEYIEIALRLAAALAAGGAIGFERSYHGRPAGFRTHTLVCLASALLMLVPVYQNQWFVTGSLEGKLDRIVIDPTRMAQGIMAGIGFVGAGTIIKEGLNVRGLTTAASIWITAALGIVIGVGFYLPALIATAFIFGTLTLFRRIEDRMPVYSFARCMVQFRRESAMPERELRDIITGHGFSITSLDYRLSAEGRHFEYRMVLRTLDPDNMRALSEAFNALPAVLEYRINPTGA